MPIEPVENVENDGLTREQFLARCELIWDSGHARPAVLLALERAADAMMRYVHYAAALKRVQENPNAPQGHVRTKAATQQKDIFDKIVEGEVWRVTQEGQEHLRTLASDPEGYAAVEVMAILTHHCQACATDPNAWWTRSGSCPHRQIGSDALPNEEGK